MKKAFGLTMIAMLAFALAACGGGNNSTGSNNSGGGDGGSAADFSSPKGCLAALDAAYQSKDVKKLVACYHVPAGKEAEFEEDASGEFKELWDAGGTSRLTYNEADLKIDGDKAEVKAKLMIKEKADAEEKSDGETVRMEKKDGVWKCVLQ
jgi:hypothetical protein